MLDSGSATQVQSLVLSRECPVHFVGIGGIGMSGLAKLLLESAFRVSGSDARESQNTRMLAELGARVSVGHQAENLPEDFSHQGVVIVSSAIDPANPEIQKAQTLGAGIFHRSQLLREIFQGDLFAHQTTVGILGTHGKTTITGMTGIALQGAQLEPTIIAGGLLPRLNTNAILGKPHGIAVAELDESDGTVLQYTPTHSVISNIELDHADHYTGGLAEVVETFSKYLSALKPDSKVFYNVMCPTTARLMENPPDHVEPVMLAAGDIFTGSETRLRYWVKNARITQRGCYQGYVYKNNRMLGELNLSVPGRHNLFNALAAIAVGDLLKADFEEMAAALKGFTGMGRRYEKVGEYNGAWLVDDYAHHPTEVLATLKAARESVKVGSGKIYALFQPHRYSRLQAFWNEFQAAFADADQVYLTDVYAASESPIDGVSGKAFCDAMKSSGIHPDVNYVSRADWGALEAKLKVVLQPQDLVLTLGAGDVTGFLRSWAL